MVGDTNEVSEPYAGDEPAIIRAASSAVEHLVDIEGVTGSIPVPPTIAKYAGMDGFARQIKEMGSWFPRGEIYRKRLRTALRQARDRAAQRNWAFDLDEEFLVNLAATQNRRCAVSGIEFSHGARGRHPFVISLDRIDAKKGYTKDNVRLVCFIVNIALSDFGDDALITMARAICARIG
jgi:hypothetical protein